MDYIYISFNPRTHALKYHTLSQQVDMLNRGWVYLGYLENIFIEGN